MVKKHSSATLAQHHQRPPSAKQPNHRIPQPQAVRKADALAGVRIHSPPVCGYNVQHDSTIGGHRRSQKLEVVSCELSSNINLESHIPAADSPHLQHLAHSPARRPQQIQPFPQSGAGVSHRTPCLHFIGIPSPPSPISSVSIHPQNLSSQPSLPHSQHATESGYIVASQNEYAFCIPHHHYTSE